MFKCVPLNKLNINDFKELNKFKNNFNVLNENFFEVYNNSNFAQRIFLRRRVKLLKKDSKYIGYIWAEMNDENIYSINALNVIQDEPDNVKEHVPYNLLISTLKKNSIISYFCENNDYNFRILKSLGFVQREGTLILYLDLSNLSNNMYLYLDNEVEFEILKLGIDEQKRCDIQNKVFKSDSRLPLSIQDIYFDEAQNYYFDKGAVFIKKDGEYIGYGQIIIEENTPIIVNFGILREYRGKGYSKSLLSYLLRIIKYNGFHCVKIKVKSTNYIALNLYKKLHFKVIRESYNWELKT